MTDTALRTPTACAGELMSAPPFAVRTEASVWAAWTLMVHHGVRHLLVTDNGRCVGVVDDRTIFAQWPLGPAALRGKPVAAVMHAPVACVSVHSELGRVAEVMVCDGVDAVPVVGDDGVAIGVISYRDVLRAVAQLSWRTP